MGQSFKSAKLIAAARKGNLAAVSFELSNGADPAGVDAFGSTALCRAAIHGRPECLRLLLPLSDPDVRDNEGMSPLMHAAWKGSEECVRLLLSCADPLASAPNGMTPLMWAAWHGHGDCVRLLLPVSNPDARDSNGRDALELARLAGGESEISALIEAFLRAAFEKSEIEEAVGPAKAASRALPKRL